jgi:hypothetical protein
MLTETFKAAMTAALQPLGFDTIQFRGDGHAGKPCGVGLGWADNRRHAITFGKADKATIETVAGMFTEWLNDNSAPDLLQAVAAIADRVEPGASVNSFVLVWDGPFGFDYNVRPEDRAGFAQRLREYADAIERAD